MRIVDKTKNAYFALLYGASGVGKTHFAATLGELGKVLIIDPDKGWQTIVNAPDLVSNKKIQDNVIVVSFDTFSDLDNALKLITANAPEKWSKAVGEEITEPFDWIVWDTWSEVQWHLMQQLRKEQNLLGVGLTFRKNVGIQHWGMLTDLNKLAIESFKAVPINQLFLMQEKVDKDENTGTVIKGPAIHGKMIAEMPPYFDVVIHSSVSATGTYTATTLTKMGWPAKTRVGVGKEVTNPKASDFFVKK